MAVDMISVFGIKLQGYKFESHLVLIMEIDEIGIKEVKQ